MIGKLYNTYHAHSSPGMCYIPGLNEKLINNYKWEKKLINILSNQN